MKQVIGLIAGLLLIAFVWGALAHASRLERAGDNKKVFIEVSSGKQISAADADEATTLNKAVLECTPVEKVCSERTGKCAVKKVK